MVRRRKLYSRRARRDADPKATIRAYRKQISQAFFRYEGHETQKAATTLLVFADLINEQGDVRLANEMSSLARRIKNGDHWSIHEWVRIEKKLETISEVRGVKRTKEYVLPPIFVARRKLRDGAFVLTRYEAAFLAKFNGISPPKRGWEVELKTIPGHEKRAPSPYVHAGEKFFLTEEYHPRERVPSGFNPTRDGRVWVIRRYE